MRVSYLLADLVCVGCEKHEQEINQKHDVDETVENSVEFVDLEYWTKADLKGDNKNVIDRDGDGEDLPDTEPLITFGDDVLLWDLKASCHFHLLLTCLLDRLVYRLVAT